MKTALIIGHSSTKKGAYNKNYKISEFDYNKSVGLIVKQLSESIDDLDIEIVYRTGTYSELPGMVNKTNADIAISLHCNAIDEKVSGTETLTSGSEKSMKLAKIFQKNMVSLFKLNNRKVKIRNSGRGSTILMETKMPTILLEPFFLDNDNDLTIGIEKQKDYAQMIINSIIEYKQS